MEEHKCRGFVICLEKGGEKPGLNEMNDYAFFLPLTDRISCTERIDCWTAVSGFSFCLAVTLDCIRIGLDERHSVAFSIGISISLA